MKKFFGLSLLVFGLVACNAGKTESGATDSISESQTEVVADVTVDTYAGVLPAADAAGYDVTLELKSDMSFVEKSVALESEAGEFVEEGTYTLDGENLVLTYTSSPDVKKALLRGDSIQLLDAEGNIPTLPYVLKLKK